ncbi:MAG: glycosyltransferase family 9 protein [Opitutaceae bacterium]|nr:glycosyltransferase family 9 protein [Opitutaceae bacterium]
MERPSPDDASVAVRILVIRRRYLGDIVLLGTTIANLHRHWPGATIAVLVEHAYREVPPLIPHVSETHLLPASATAWPGFLLRIRRERFTHVFDFDNAERTAVISGATGAAFRATYTHENRRTRFPWLYTLLAALPKAVRDSQSAIDTYHDLLQASGIPTPLQDLRLIVSEEARIQAKRLISGPCRKVLVHPGTRSPFRLWPVDRFAELIDRIQERLGAQVFVVGGPGEQATIRKIHQLTRTHAVSLNNAFSVENFAALVAQCDLFICHDSGPMHISAAVGTPVVALFGSQNAAIWKPHGTHHVSLQTDLPCSCFPATQLPAACIPLDSYRSYCVRKLSVERVFDAAESQLNCMMSK